MTREQLEAAFCTSPSSQGRSSQYRRVNGIEDFLFIASTRGGTAPPADMCKSGKPHELSAARFAERLGVSTRTIVRWRKALKEAS
jgi:hypothetical protein